MSLSVDRLLKLPPVFSLHDLTRHTYLGRGMSLDAAKKFLTRMQEKSYIAAAGARTAHYYNLLKDPYGARNRPLEVAELLYPEAIVIGINVLHAYGWVNQIPRTIDVAVNASRRTLCKIDGIELRPRPRAWFAEQQSNDAVLRHGESPFMIDSLTPRAALDDIYKVRDMWVPGHDDLFIPSDEEEGVERLSQSRLMLRDR